MNKWEMESTREEFEHAGLRCLILRHDEFKHLCGYVGVDLSHPWYGINYNQCLLGCSGTKRFDCAWSKHHPSPEKLIDIHGGLTFSRMGDKDSEYWPAGIWWFGFDCAHAGDLSPGLRQQGLELGLSLTLPGDTYRDIEYVSAEAKSMAEQLRKYGKSGWFWSRYWGVYWRWLAFKENWCWKLRSFKRDYMLGAWFRKLWKSRRRKHGDGGKSIPGTPKG